MRDHQQTVINYYNRTKREYKVLWRSKQGLSLHFGYYDKTIHNHNQAVNRLNEKLADLIEVDSSDRILDAGCGVGGSLIWLASHRRATGVGINITPWQIEFARREAKQRGLANRITFQVGNYSHTDLPNSAFTVFWGVESIVHAEDKSLVLGEAFRLLKPGGRLVIAEYLLQDQKLGPNDEKLIATWLGGWAMPSLLSEQQYRHNLSRAGFGQISVEDWTEAVRPSLNRLRKFANLLTPLAQLLLRLRIINPTQIKNLQATNAQMSALDRNLWRYRVIVARKP